MNACGLIVEYNPFHNGHVYHIQETKRITQADCIIAVMSGSFLQRGEPAIIDKYHRAKAALEMGVDLVLELPYAFAVQGSDLFARGAVSTLHKAGVDSICFGSESGEIQPFIDNYHYLNEHKIMYQKFLKAELKQGSSFPSANHKAIEKISENTNVRIDLSQPNNILGNSYVQEIFDANLTIKPLTIKRTQAQYHDEEITSSIASATAIRKSFFVNNLFSDEIKKTMPSSTINQLYNYKKESSSFHNWEAYFQLLQYRVQIMSHSDLALIEGVDEGLEYRIKRTSLTASSINDWLKQIKTKRYTWTRLQRIFVHILTNTHKEIMTDFKSMQSVPYIHILGMNTNGKNYLNFHKKEISVPIITKFQKEQHSMLELEERTSLAYYSILPAAQKRALFMREFKGPVQLLNS